MVVRRRVRTREVKGKREVGKGNKDNDDEGWAKPGQVSIDKDGEANKERHAHAHRHCCNGRVKRKTRRSSRC